MIKFWNWFTKITAWPIQKILFRTKIYYEDKRIQGRKIKQPSIIVCNHTSVFDYAVLLFVFVTRTVRYLIAEVLFRKKLLGWYLKNMGGIRVDRETHDFSFLYRSEHILEHGGCIGIFPESRLPKEGEERPLPFKTSVIQLALSTGAPIIPVYTNGSYFQWKRARVIIGKPIDVTEWVDTSLDEKENIQILTNKLRNSIIKLGNKLYEQGKKD